MFVHSDYMHLVAGAYNLLSITVQQEMLTKGTVDEFDESVWIRQHLICQTIKLAK